MDSGLLLASISTLSCVALGLAVGLRRERSLIASTALALLLAIALWSGALGFASWQGPGAVAALRIAALGTFSATGLWLLLALRHRWPRRFRGAAPMAIALAPAWLFLAAALTNESHGLAFRAGSRRCASPTGRDRSRASCSPGRSRASPRERRCSRSRGCASGARASAGPASRCCS